MQVPEKRERVQTYAKDTTRKMKTDLKLCDTDGDGENPRQKKKIQSPKRNGTVITSSSFKKCGNLTR